MTIHTTGPTAIQEIENMMKRFWGALTLSVLISFTVSVFLYHVLSRAYGPPRSEALETQLAATLRNLQDNSAQALRLLADLQAEVTTRTRRVHDIEAKLQELQQQRAILELTEGQRRAIASLIRRESSFQEIVTSTEFWIGRVLPGALFFLMGVLLSLRMRRFPSQQLPADDTGSRASENQEPVGTGGPEV